ncbi:hypothetical protein [Lederbergia citri]|uniref:Uncharacterized protein n=1 Tax=Lederbergia citri TaxID=2833580 RepID=A0A942TKX5_9BACI|nr:hypothetical protein [Lederbergia citri]MBS4197917.1 hypothetical protein [Lederbergia citri]
MANSKKIRLAGVASITGGLIQIVLGILLSTGMDPDIMPYGQIAYSLSVLLLSGGLLGLLWLKALGRGKWLLVIPLLGFVSQEIAHGIIFYYWDNTVNQPFKPIGAMLVAVGMVACGIATIRAKVWSGWSKVAPLLIGVYFFLGPLIALIVTKEPNFVLIMMWGLFWANLGFAIISNAKASEIRFTNDINKGVAPYDTFKD